MPSLTAILAPFALLLPLGAIGLPPVASADVATQGDASRDVVWRDGPAGPRSVVSGSLPIWSGFSDPVEGQTANQVRIERRVILRVSPRIAPARNSLMADLPGTPMPPRVTERKVGKCLEVAKIVGVQPDRGNRLMLFMRDQRVIAADLERSCSARDFYSGFYYERHKDGQLCVERDRLQSRSGAKCQLSRLRQLLFEDE